MLNPPVEILRMKCHAYSSRGSIYLVEARQSSTLDSSFNGPARPEHKRRGVHIVDQQRGDISPMPKEAKIKSGLYAPEKAMM